MKKCLFNKSTVQNPAVVDKTFFGYLLAETGLERIGDNEQLLQLIS